MLVLGVWVADLTAVQFYFCFFLLFKKLVNYNAGFLFIAPIGSIGHDNTVLINESVRSWKAATLLEIGPTNYEETKYY